MTEDNQKTESTKPISDDDSNYYQFPLEPDVSQTSCIELSDMKGWMKDNGWVWDEKQKKYVEKPLQ